MSLITPITAMRERATRDEITAMPPGDDWLISRAQEAARLALR
jgi:hypothetical protein